VGTSQLMLEATVRLNDARYPSKAELNELVQFILAGCVERSA